MNLVTCPSTAYYRVYPGAWAYSGVGGLGIKTPNSLEKSQNPPKYFRPHKKFEPPPQKISEYAPAKDFFWIDGNFLGGF